MDCSKNIFVSYLNHYFVVVKQANARGLADCGLAKLAWFYANFAGKTRLKNRAVAIRLQPLVRRGPTKSRAALPRYLHFKSFFSFFLNIGLDRRFFKMPAVQFGFVFFLIISVERFCKHKYLGFCREYQFGIGERWLGLFLYIFISLCLYICLTLTDSLAWQTNLAQRHFSCFSLLFRPTRFIAADCLAVVCRIVGGKV